VIAPEADVFAPDGQGRGLVLYPDPRRSAESIRRFSARDADAYIEYRAAVERVTTVIASLFQAPPPHVDAPRPRDLWNLMRTGRTFRALGRRDGQRLLRWGPMPAADLMGEWFETDVLSAALAAPGLAGAMLGPRSAGSALVLLLHETHRHLAGGHWVARGGPGAVTAAMARAAQAAGAEIRTNTVVERILTHEDRVVGVVAGGQEIAADVVLSAVDPKTTFLRLVDPSALSPEFAMRIRNYRARGTVAKINLALAAVPRFAGAPEVAALSGRIHVGPGLDALERAFDYAKYGEVSPEPWLEATIPSIADPQLAPAGAHVMSIYAHYAPAALRGSTWDVERPRLLHAVLRTLDTYAPGFAALVVAADVMAPDRLESEHHYFGGHIFHGELTLDQLFTMRPLLGHGRYDSPIQGLHLCGGGTHPGGFLTGASGRHAARLLTTA
jgi:phytoene dehydrogenase-like protein